MQPLYSAVRYASLQISSICSTSPFWEVLPMSEILVSARGDESRLVETYLPILRRTCEKLENKGSLPLFGIELDRVCYGLWQVSARFQVGVREHDTPAGRRQYPVYREVGFSVFNAGILAESGQPEYEVRSAWTKFADESRMLEPFELEVEVETGPVSGFVTVYTVDYLRYMVATSPTSLRPKFGDKVAWEEQFSTLDIFTLRQGQANDEAKRLREGDE
jgi:hypothetical protein